MEAIDTEGWLHTGDLGRYDMDGWFFLVDRIKEMIKYHAYQVSPSELEAVISTIPGVAEVAVVGTPDCICGELPSALVVRQPDAIVKEIDIQQYVASELILLLLLL
jgi:acyl-CoA synthetase (AMP-forming)/AMP-acid ligase II